MSERTRLGLYVIGVGLLLGLAGDALLRATPWGLNFALWVGSLMVASLLLKRWGRGRDAGRDDSRASTRRTFFADEGAWALPCALLFAAAFAWRDSATLLALNGLAVLALLSVALLGGWGGRVLRAGATDYWVAGAAAVGGALFAPLFLLGRDVKWNEVPHRGWTRQAAAVLRGLLIAVPLLLFFGGLFTAADAVYARLVSRTFNLDPDLVVSHLCLSLFVAWASAGYLRSLLMPRSGVGEVAEVGSVVVLGLCSTERRAQPTANPKASEPAAARQTGDGAGASPSGGGAASYWPPPPSVTELPDESTQQVPHSVVVESKETAASSPGAEKIGAEASAGVAGAGGVPTTEVAGACVVPGAEAGPVLRLGVVEVGVALGMLNVLFMSFAAVQVRYLFGGAGVVVETAGLTYAEYARRGFFELVWAAALVLPVLLAAHWLLRKEGRVQERIFRWLAGGLLLMLFVVMASALWRMRLYQGEYGQTELRFYTTAFMGWLALVFVWFALTVLRGQREWFAFGALVAALVVTGLLNVVNPSARIVRANAALARERGFFDAEYATSLGADAVPALLEAAPSLDRSARAEIARNLLVRGWAVGDWRSWNLSRARAGAAVAEYGEMLSGWALPEPERAASAEGGRGPSPTAASGASD
jgi:hypothetical protein